MALCDRCKNKCKFMLKNKTLDTCGLFEKQTNFDRITKTPEALAEFLSDTCCRLLRDVWSNDGETGEGYWQEDESEWLNWLKQESE